MSLFDDPPVFGGYLGEVFVQNALDKRDLFAAMAMQAIITSGISMSMRDTVGLSVAHADALIAELKKKVDQAAKEKQP